MEINGVAHTFVTASDFEASVAFYRQLLPFLGMEIVADIIQIFDHYDYDCEVLAASLRHPLHVVEAARMGADIGTMPMSVFTQLLKHPLTDAGLKRFLEDWERTKAQLAAKASR